MFLIIPSNTNYYLILRNVILLFNVLFLSFSSIEFRAVFVQNSKFFSENRFKILVSSDFRYGFNLFYKI